MFFDFTVTNFGYLLGIFNIFILIIVLHASRQCPDSFIQNNIF